MKCTAFIALNVLVLTACGPGTLTVKSAPEGALISYGNKSLGLAPFVASLPSSDKAISKDAKGCYLTTGFTARWASGATAASPNPTTLCNGLNADYVVEIARPADAPGLQADLQAANERENALAKQREADSINNLANAEEMDAMMYGGPFGYGYGYY